MSVHDDIQLVLASHFFTADFYAERVRFQFASPEEAAHHYLTEGWLSNASPSTRFDGRYYIATNDDVREAGVNPLVHFPAPWAAGRALALAKQGPGPGKTDRTQRRRMGSGGG